MIGFPTSTALDQNWRNTSEITRRLARGKGRGPCTAWKMYIAAKSTVMVLDDLRKALGDTQLHVLVIPERVQVSNVEWQWLAASYPDVYRHTTEALDPASRAALISIRNRGEEQDTIGSCIAADPTALSQCPFERQVMMDLRSLRKSHRVQEDSQTNWRRRLLPL